MKTLAEEVEPLQRELEYHTGKVVGSGNFSVSNVIKKYGK